MMEIRWVSRHALSPAQLRAIGEIHGDITVVNDPATFNAIDDLTNYLREHAESFVYVVAPADMCLHAGFAGLQFGLFKNSPSKRSDGQFGLDSVVHVSNGSLKVVWVNPNPDGDVGDQLIPVRR